MAELLKRYYPKYVEVQNYIPACSVAKKSDNWCTLNRKVFSKLDMKLNKDTINKLSQSQPGVIEKVLIEVHAKILKDCNTKHNSLLKECEEPNNNETIKYATNPEESLNQTVPCKAFIKLKKELDVKTEAINILLKKVEHLENMLKFKEQRIEDLTTQIQTYIEKI